MADCLINRKDAIKRQLDAAREYKGHTCSQVFHNMVPFLTHQKTAHAKPSPNKKRSHEVEAGTIP